MKKIVISYKSRNTLMQFVKRLRINGFSAQIINTPSKISSSCGLSARIDYSYLKPIISIIQQSQLPGLIGVFSIEQFGLQEIVTRLY